MSYRIINADVLGGLAQLPDGSVQCVVTSPPYWGLRRYGGWFMQILTGDWCDFVKPRNKNKRVHWKLRLKWRASERGIVWAKSKKSYICALGLEPTPEMFIDRMVAVFREVKRVMRDDGTLWLNMGDSYASNPASGGIQSKKMTGGEHKRTPHKTSYSRPKGLKPKDLCGIPWRLALALQADGWWLRSDIIWSKPNPMPESCTDRPTKSHEYIFLLSKAARYYFDQDAVREKATYLNPNPGTLGAIGVSMRNDSPAKATSHAIKNGSAGRNIRTVWEIPTFAMPEAHFATFPPRLPEICIKAGTSERGCCPECGAGWVRVVETNYELAGGKGKEKYLTDESRKQMQNTGPQGMKYGRANKINKTTGWRPGCECNAGEPIPCTVLEPFAGAGTTLMVAEALGRDSIGIELNPEYVEMIRKRIESNVPFFDMKSEVK